MGKQQSPQRNDTINVEHLDSKAARRQLVSKAKKVAEDEDNKLEKDRLSAASNYNKVAAYRGVGLGLYFKLLPWLIWMMLWMMLCSVPYLIVINRSVFTDADHKNDHTYGIKVYDGFELASFTFAAIVDDDKDGGVLKYMNTDIADTWKGPMLKGTFLTWISLLDAGATVVLTGVIVVLFFVVDRWLSQADDNTREVADYSIIVCGLPETITATEIGNYFQEHFGEDTVRDKVMDVVLVKNLAIILRACKKVHKYEELKGFVDNIKLAAAESAANATTSAKQLAQKAGGAVKSAATAAAAVVVATNDDGTDPEAAKPPLKKEMSRNMSRRMSKTESKIQNQRSLINSRIESGKMTTKAAFVTFNTEKMRINACKHMPSGWWSAWFIRKRYLLEHNGKKHRVWVQHASAPDDYCFEHLSTRVRTNFLIQLFTGFVMFVFVVICAAFITWLTEQSNKWALDLKWDNQAVFAPLQSFLNTTTNSGRRLQSSVDITGFENLYNYCKNSSTLAQCSSNVNRNINRGLAGAKLNMTWEKEWSFGTVSSNRNNTLTRLLFERPVRKYLQECSADPNLTTCYIGSSNVDVSACLPCYCMGLSFQDTNKATSDFMSHIEDTCDSYWTPFDIQRDGVKTAISFVIAIINSLLVYVLRILKFYVERHWTITDTELSFAIWTYLVKLVNSVAVLLIVNCSTLSDLQTSAIEGSANSDSDNGWLRNLILNGKYDDFTPAWYESVGFSILVLMMINVSGPFVRTIVEYAIKIALRVQLQFCHFGKLAAPEDYNLAWRTPQFTLEQRTSDILFNVTLALLFGSGMPLCYLICAVYLFTTYWWDRVSLLTLNQPAQRYSRDLPKVIMFFLPVLLVLHCAFGLWMHTYFYAEMDRMNLLEAATSSISNEGVNDLTDNTVGKRITQPNGLALLIWFIVLVFWLCFGRWIIWGTLKCLGNGCAKLASVLELFAYGDGGHAMTYEEALSSSRILDQLRGAPTYRIHHLHGYREYLSGDAGRLWRKAQGQERYTRLTTFRVHVEVDQIDEDGAHSIKEQEVMMFDVSDNVLTTVPKILLDTPMGSELPGGGLSGLPSAALQATVLKQMEALAAQGTYVRKLSLRPSQVTSTMLPSSAGYDMVLDGELVPAAVAAAAAAQLGGAVSVQPGLTTVLEDAAIASSVSAPTHGVSAGGAATVAISTTSSAPVGGVYGSTAAATGVAMATGAAAAALSHSGSDANGRGSGLQADDVKLSVEEPSAPPAWAGETLPYPTVPGSGGGNYMAPAAPAPATAALYPAIPGYGGEAAAAAAYPPISSGASAAMMAAVEEARKQN